VPFRSALEQWPRDGVPGNPRARLVSTGRFKAIGGDVLEDDRLRLKFACSHAALATDAQVALTLRAPGVCSNAMPEGETMTYLCRVHVDEKTAGSVVGSERGCRAMSEAPRTIAEIAPARVGPVEGGPVRERVVD
jgi:hypothetical protein